METEVVNFFLRRISRRLTDLITIKPPWHHRMPLLIARDQHRSTLTTLTVMRPVSRWLMSRNTEEEVHNVCFCFLKYKKNLLKALRMHLARGVKISVVLHLTLGVAICADQIESLSCQFINDPIR